MDKISPRPYKLFNKIQYYEWGTKNNNAYIPHFLGIDVIHDMPYAELWIGAHPKAPSEIIIESTSYPLDKIISLYPGECLGDYTAQKFNNTLPFLLKVLSAARALSIQTHPNKEQAKQLHTSDPVNYPDDNHKPEIAIAIDFLNAVAGFRSLDEIAANLNKHPELLAFAGKDFDKSPTANKGELQENIRDLYSNIMRSALNREKLSTVINSIVKRLSDKKDLAPDEEQFLKQFKLYGIDAGLLSFFFFNIINLKPRQAIFTGAGVPHAYLQGNIIECMANSDNVVRAGLTNKFQDIETLLKILKYDFSGFGILNEEQKADELIYKTGAEEFQIVSFNKKRAFRKILRTGNKPAVILIKDGTVSVEWVENNEQVAKTYTKGESLFIPAIMSDYKITSDKAEFFLVEIP
ncbi:MAG: mannose-6-phosphate isomerase, class I [Ignavibacteriaceae bacterium]